MATLKEHQAAMVDLLANGSGIPASASRLAHAMHDVLAYLVPKQEDDYFDATGFARLIKAKREAETTPGLSDKAFAERQKPLKTDSPAKWPTPAEQRVKELENTIRQLKANLVKVRGERDMLHGRLLEHEHPTEQAGCRKEDTQHDVADKALKIATDYAELGIKYVELVRILAFYGVDDLDKARAEYLKYNGSPEQSGCRKPDTQLCEHEWFFSADGGPGIGEGYFCNKCGAAKK